MSWRVWKPRILTEKVGVSLRVAGGTAEQNRVYCSKTDENVIIWGESASKSKVGQGRRTDWDTVHELAQAQAPVTDFLEAVPHLGYAHITKIGQWREAHAPAMLRSEPTRPIILFGYPGAGKSFHARTLFPDAWEKGTREAKGWNGYDGISDIIINEMDGGWFTYTDLKNLLDTGTFRGECKYGGYVTICAKRCIMTCNEHPAFWYKDSQYRKWDGSNALRRRIKQFGELWVFRPATENADGSYTYHQPVRDIELMPPAAENEYGADVIAAYDLRLALDSMGH